MNVLRHRHYLLAVLFVVVVLNSIDGVAMAVVLQDIKRDLSLTDTQLGVLTGFAFALLFSIMGIAIARWADCGDRVAIVSLTAIVWSVFVAACGTATNFMKLLLLRVGVGIGEAGCFPASQSLIADYFDRAERPQANAVYVMATGVSALVGYGLAGWLNEIYGWRVMFMMLGLPGIAVAAVAWLTLREPRFERSGGDGVGRFALARRSLLKTVTSTSASPRLAEIGVALWSNTTLRQVLLFWSVQAFFTTGLWQWQPAFFVRSHGLGTGELGTCFAVAYGLGGVLGPFLGGAWAARYAANNERLQLRVAGLSYSALMVISAFVYLVPNHYLAFGLLGLQVLIASAFFGPVLSVLQLLVPESMRAAAMAILALLGSLIGSGLGSLATGALSDALLARFGEESLRYALLTLCPGFLWAGWHLWQASKCVARDLSAMDHERDGFGEEMQAAPASPEVIF